MTLEKFKGVKFPLGQTVMTRGVADKVAVDTKFAEFTYQSLKRHANGDWGELCDEDKRANEDALKSGERLFSAYTTAGYEYHWPGFDKIWIITEADRSVTTILFPEEY